MPGADPNEQHQPTNPLVTAMLTDLYQITMTYAHWKNGKHNEPAVFELFFRKNPFHGEFTIFCGMDECMKFIQSYKFTEDDIAYLKTTPSLQNCEDEFFEYLQSFDPVTQLEVFHQKEGSVVFPRIPLLIIEGPLGLGQLMETTLLNLVNYPSLIATNAARMVIRANGKSCVEFGLRRAQGPDGAMSASKYSYIGGFTATSNVHAGKVFGIPISGTHAHAFVQSYTSLDEVATTQLLNTKTNEMELLLPKVLALRSTKTTNDGELAAFIAYAAAFPKTFLCLIDTYDTIHSGLPNFLYVAQVLEEMGYKPIGIRLDSGDLNALSLECAKVFNTKNYEIVASNDINEASLNKLASSSAITIYGIGTNLVTCQAQPALGCVYKLVECNQKPRIKISQEIVKVTIPGRKRAYRLFVGNDKMTMDYMTFASDDVPQINQALICRNPFHSTERYSITPTKVVPLHQKLDYSFANIKETREYTKSQLKELSSDVTAYENPTSYPIMVSQSLYDYLYEIWEREAPIPEMK
mmetsp:Transcript_14833/g.41980  ORF Transcript_14833/g.41980 Transcript_14833/m.41980 type:complete len:523 (+) Transcript_14833:131-1699(+)